MSRIKSISLLAGAAIGIATVASAQTNDTALALSAEIAAQHNTMGSSLQAAGGPTVSGFTKVRINYNSRDSVPGGGEDVAEGFTVPETRLQFAGSVEDFGYVVSGEFDQNGDFMLKDAYGSYDMGNGWVGRWGQLKAPFLREEAVSDTGLQGVDRSIVNQTFSMGYVQGSRATYTAENWRGSISLSDGARTANTDFTSAQEADFSITGRFEYLLTGADWSAFDDFASFRGSDRSYMFGGAIQYQTGGESFAVGSGSTADLDLLGVTGDFTAEGNGWSAFAEFVYISIQPEGGSDLDHMGFVAQGGYFFNDSWEGFGRYAATIPDDSGGLEDFSAVTVGVNKYFIPGSQAAKLTIAADFFIDEQGASVVPASTNANLLSSADDSQWGLRGQLQLVF